MTVSCELCDSAILPRHRNRLGPSPFAKADVYASLCAHLGVSTDPDDKPWELANLPLCSDCHGVGRKLGVELQELTVLQRKIRKDLDVIKKKIRQSVRANDEEGQEQDHPFRTKVRKARFNQGKVEIPQRPEGEDEGQLVEVKEEPDENLGDNAEDIVNREKQLEVPVPANDPGSNGDVSEVYCDPLGLGNEDSNGSGKENEYIPPTKRRKTNATTSPHPAELLHPQPQDVANLQDHPKGKGKHLCTLCLKKFGKNKEKLLNHLYNMHENRTTDEEKTLVCGKKGCGKRFLVQMTLDKHLEGHEVEELMPLKCSLCDTRFPVCGEELMEHHKTTCHRTPPIKHCVYPGCDRVYNRPLQLRQHHRRDHPDMLTYICEIPHCAAKYSEELHYQTHRRTHQTGEGPFLCAVCQRSSQSPFDLSKHLTKHTGEDGIPCPDCPVRVNTKSEFISHRVKEHGDEKQFKCGLCDHSFETEDHLTNHENEMHSPLPLGVCDLCDKVFGTPHFLRSHVDLVHRKQRKGSCPICGKMPDLGDLEVHIILFHEVRRSHQCSTCGKMFSNGSILQNHEIIHRPEGGRLYSCDVCGLAFTQSKTVKEHMKKHKTNEAVSIV